VRFFQADRGCIEAAHTEKSLPVYIIAAIIVDLKGDEQSGGFATKFSALVTDFAIDGVVVLRCFLRRIYRRHSAFRTINGGI